MKQLLIVAHTPSSNTKNLGLALYKGCIHADFTHVTTTLKSPFDCTKEDVLQTDALILFTTENFGYMSGALKDFFDRIYYDCLEHTNSLPYALVIRAGIDGTGTERAVQSIAQGLKWRTAQATLICQGDFQKHFIQDCKTLGMTFAAALDNDLL